MPELAQIPVSPGYPERNHIYLGGGVLRYGYPHFCGPVGVGASAHSRTESVFRSLYFGGAPCPVPCPPLRQNGFNRSSHGSMPMVGELHLNCNGIPRTCLLLIRVCARPPFVGAEVRMRPRYDLRYFPLAFRKDSIHILKLPVGKSKSFRLVLVQYIVRPALSQNIDAIPESPFPLPRKFRLPQQ